MKITNFEIFPITIPLRTPFIISAETQTDYFGVLLKLTTDDGLEGWGEAVPSERVTGETFGSVKNALDTIIKPLVMGQDAEDFESIMDTVETVLRDQPSACCAVDLALHDLKGKKAKLPVKHLLGGYRENIPISFTIVIGSVEEAVKSAHEYLDMGAKVLKVKLGVNPEEDVARIKALREVFGNEIKLTGDANQGYSVTQAIDTLNKLSKYDLEFVEQPVHADDVMGLATIRQAVEVPIMADESACTVADALKLVKLNAVDMINIKLMKCGGLRNAVKISNIAEAAGMVCQIGCMIETGVAITAGTHLALGLKNIQYADLDGHLFLKHNIVKDHQITQNGCNTISGRAGLGVGVDYSVQYFIRD
ncbi:mandelate racemase/muconate lactonizing enzyme family protein [[Eubacterium] cellulosolvens]